MRGTARSTFALATSFALLYAGAARAAPTAADKARAAAAYDQGVQHFDQAEYRAAAKAFLKADAIVPSADAVENAIVAARKASAYLLVVKAAQFAQARAPDNAKLATEAREALAEAAPHLARVELGCDVAPCHMALDGDPVSTGNRYLLPGTHSVDAVSGAAKAHRDLSLDAGATYRVVMHPVQARAAVATPHAAAPGPRQAQHTAAAAREKPSSPPPDTSHHRPLPPGVFWVGAGVTVALAGVMTWSGLDALSAKRDLPADYTPAQGNDVRSRMRRTDYLLGGALVAGAVTAWMGLSLVDWGGGKASAAIAPTRGGALGTVSGRF